MAPRISPHQQKGKKRVARHIQKAVDAKSQRAEKEKEAGEVLQEGPSLKGKKRQRRERDAAPPEKEGEEEPVKVKDLAEARAYLIQWQAKQNDSTSSISWKFNKNHQSWLVRHAYNPQVLDEEHFDVLCSYLEGLKGGQRQRLLESAKELIDKHAPPEDEGERGVSSGQVGEAEADAAKEGDEGGKEEEGASKKNFFIYDRALKLAEALT